MGLKFKKWQPELPEPVYMIVFRSHLALKSVQEPLDEDWGNSFLENWMWLILITCMILDSIYFKQFQYKSGII